MDSNLTVETFHWSECTTVLGALANSKDFQLEPGGRFFEAHDVRVVPPLVFPLPAMALTTDDSVQASARRKAAIENAAKPAPSSDLYGYLESLPHEPATQCVILLQAGIASLGMFQGGDPMATRTLKRYVVRGKGRAQPAFLATKGKSRYGSRLRLQNARLLVDETNEKLCEYWDEYGAAEQIYVGASKRLFPDLFRGKERPPFEPDVAYIRIPLDLPKPTTSIMLRAYKSLCYGRVERAD
jgi:hypothetical protein